MERKHESRTNGQDVKKKERKINEKWKKKWKIKGKKGKETRGKERENKSW